MSKEFKMGFIEEVKPLKLTTIPKKYQKFIEATENRWFNKMQKLAKICQKRIAELEAKLAESDEYRELLLEEKAGYLDLISGYADKCKKLKQQLAEARKKVCEQISAELYTKMVVYGEIPKYTEIVKILDEIAGGK